MDGLAVVDVRQRAEYQAGHVPGAHHMELGDLPARADVLPDEPTVVMCGRGERAMTAASLLERAGHRDVSVLAAGPDDWVAANATGLDTGA
jgi:hydroxyacylglutathione hydrolase